MTVEELETILVNHYAHTSEPIDISQYNIKIDITIKGYKYPTEYIDKIDIDHEKKLVYIKGKVS